MTSLHLDKLLSGHVFGFLLIFSRFGAVLMLMPGIGESYVSPRLRMMLALSVSFLLMTPLMPIMPPPPGSIPDLVRLLGFEIVIGLFYGSLLRLIVSSLETAGSIIALQIGLSNAVILNPSQAVQSPLPSAFLSIAGVTLVFVSGLDHYLIRSLMQTYSIFPPGGVLMPGDMAQSFIHFVSRSFAFGIELAGPFLAGGLLMFLALGIMQKLMPQVQLFLVALPAQILGGMFLVSITIAGIMAAWLSYFDQSVGDFLER